MGKFGSGTRTEKSNFSDVAHSHKERIGPKVSEVSTTVGSPGSKRKYGRESRDSSRSLERYNHRHGEKSSRHSSYRNSWGKNEVESPLKRTYRTRDENEWPKNRNRFAGRDGREGREKKKNSMRMYSDRRSPSEDFDKKRDRSRERERQRRRKQMESVRVNRTTSDNVFWDGFQWVSRLEAPSSGVFDQHMNATRQMRQLKISNLPPLNHEVCEEAFRVFLTNHVYSLGLAVTPYPVVHVWFDPQNGTEKGTGLIELATMEETDVVMGFTGVFWAGHNVKFTRPDNVQLITPFVPQKKVLSGPSKVPHAATTLPSVSRVVRIENPQQEVPANDEDWEELVEDLIDGTSAFGGVISTLAVTEVNCVDLPFAKTGDIFLEFETEEAAEKCMEGLQGRIYDGKAICIHRIAMALWKGMGGKKRRDI